MFKVEMRCFKRLCRYGFVPLQIRIPLKSLLGRRQFDLRTPFVKGFSKTFQGSYDTRRMSLNHRWPYKTKYERHVVS